ncbi:serine proteinase inhibitor IA-1 [Peniophora sp. CONT]|nr:serine proteinase inhibitor IA-1 [Peniophora sp. CONT]
MSQKYIVVFNKSTSAEDIEKEIAAVEAAGGEVHQKYTTSLKGFSATIPESHLQSLKNLQGDGGKIQHIEADGEVHTQ